MSSSWVDVDWKDRPVPARFADARELDALCATLGRYNGVMQIVPDRDALIPELRLSPRDRDQVSVGQEVELRFSAFNQPTTPTLTGQVTSMAADLSKDERTGESYYSIRVHVLPVEWSRLGKLMPAAGMPVEAFIRTSEHTVLAYLAKPFSDQMARAFREE